MFRLAATKLVPVMRPCGKAIMRAVPERNIWDLRPDIRSVIRDFERLEREVFDRFPLRKLAPRAIPIEGTEPLPYRVNIDVNGFKPEEINVSVSNGLLKIRAKMERNAEDGSKFYQEVCREITIPENVTGNELKSYLNHDGVLVIEAPLKPHEKPKEIPVTHEK